MNKEIKNINDKGLYHGYQQWFINNKHRLRGNFKNNSMVGYLEYHYFNKTIFFIK